jgi:hypothetical protein
LPPHADRDPDPQPGRSAAIAGPRLEPELAGELHAGAWQYPWELAPGIHARTRDPLARQIAWVREAAIEPYALDGLALNDERAALDLSCGEGRLAHRLLDWGAKRVLAVSDDPEALRRAQLLRKHFAIDPGELELRPAGELEPAREPEHDVVLLVPTSGREELIELAAARCRGICAFECTDEEADGVAEAALAAGFASVTRVKPPTHAVTPFLLGEREILVAAARRSA